MELQAIRYAAMVSTMTFERMVDVYSRYLISNGSSEDAREALLDFLGWQEPDEDAFAQDVRIILASANFSKDLTTAVRWLNDRGLDIHCIRIKPYTDGGRTLINVQQIIPLQEAAEYQIQLREKEQLVRKERAERSNLRRFWKELKALAEGKTNLHSNSAPSDGGALITTAGAPGLRYIYVVGQHEGRAEFYINCREASANKKVFDELCLHKDKIEKTFGGPLSWERLDNKISSRIAYYVRAGGSRDEESWPPIQAELIEAMVRLEKALAPFVPQFK
jgi:hypothetical protein